MNHTLCHTGKKISSILSKVIGDEGRGRGDSSTAFYSVKLCVLINLNLRHNVLCFSFVVVLYSMYSFYAIIKVKWLPLMKEVVMCDKNLMLNSPLKVRVESKTGIFARSARVDQAVCLYYQKET